MKIRGSKFTLFKLHFYGVESKFIFRQFKKRENRERDDTKVLKRHFQLDSVLPVVISAVG